MGVAITTALARAGHRVRAWNRTPRSRADHGLDGLDTVELSPTPADAVASVDLAVICVRDHTASRAVIEQIAAVPNAPVVVNVSTGTPSDAIRSAEHARRLGLRYVTGAVMVPTPMVGTDDAMALYAGAADDIDAARPLLTAMGGISDVVGEDHAVPPALDLAMLDVYFAGMYAFLHSAALVGAHGIDPLRYLPYAEGIVATLGGTLPDLAESIQQRTYDSGQARLDMCLAFLQHIVTTSREVDLEPGIAALVRDASAAATTRWPGSTDWDVVAEDLLRSLRTARTAA